MGGSNRNNLNLVTSTGTAGLLGAAVSFAVFVFKEKTKKKGLLPKCDTVCVNLSAKEILELADKIISDSTQVHDAVASIPQDKLSYEKVVLPLAEMEARQSSLIQCCVFPKMVSPHELVRRASTEAEQKIKAHILSCRKREDVYRVLKSYAAKGEFMDVEAKCYLKCLIRDFEDNGIFLSALERREMETLIKKIDELSLQYVQNLNDDTSCLSFTEAELVGLPLQFLKGLNKNQKREFILSLETDHITAILESCKIARTRKIAAMAYGMRCIDKNITVLQDLVRSRRSLARLFGYPHFADYVLDRRMSKTSTNVIEFLENLSSSLTEPAMKELSVLKDLKRKEEGESPFGIEDLLYYIKKVVEMQSDLHIVDTRQYFHVSLVLPGLFRLCQDLFGIIIEEVIEIDVWCNDVRAFTVFDSRSRELLGYFYLDMFTREGKISHSCVVALQNHAQFSKGACQIPVVLLVAQFEKNVSGEAMALEFSEVVNLFHEFGHVVQHICNRASFARFSGLHVDDGFKEIPCQILENWCYEPFSLNLISGFRQDINKKLADEVKRRHYSFLALLSLHEILYCLLDQKIYNAEDGDHDADFFLKLFKDLHPKVMLGIPMMEGTNHASCFSQAVIGSEATLYSSLWSKVYAADIFAKMFENGHPNLTMGLRFRDEVLAPGGSKKSMDLLTCFLGRVPSAQAFTARDFLY